MFKVRYKDTKNKNLINKKKTKAILSLQGRLYIDCLVVSYKRGQKIISRQIGEDSGNMKNFDFHVQGAINNAIYKHMKEKNVSGGIVEIIYNYYIKYFNDDLNVKREYVKPPQKIVEVPATSRFIKRKVKEKVKINVKPHIRGGKKVKGYSREVTRIKTINEEVLVKGYTYKKTIGKGYYKSKATFKGKEVLSEAFKTRRVSYLNKQLIGINKAKERAKRVTRLF